jgi:hypothetical protein
MLPLLFMTGGLRARSLSNRFAQLPFASHLFSGVFLVLFRCFCRCCALRPGLFTGASRAELLDYWLSFATRELRVNGAAII